MGYGLDALLHLPILLMLLLLLLRLVDQGCSILERLHGFSS